MGQFQSIPITVDEGNLASQNPSLYPRSDFHYDSKTVKSLITSRKLSPFYKPTLENSGDSKMECPICFLYYPSNINRARCCDQPICTDCFVQLKRNQETWNSVTCPFCVQDDFGIVYDAPNAKLKKEPVDNQNIISTKDLKRRTFLVSNPKVVSCDDIRPDWRVRMEKYLEERAQNQRRANALQNMALVAAQRAEEARILNPLIQLGNANGDPRATMEMISNILGSLQVGDDAPMRSTRDVAIRLSQLNSMGLNLEELMIMEATRRSMMDQPDRDSDDGDVPLGLLNDLRQGE